MLSILGWLVNIFKKVSDIYTLMVQNDTDQRARDKVLQADIDQIKIVIGIGVPVTETIIFGNPKP